MSEVNATTMICHYCKSEIKFGEQSRFINGEWYHLEHLRLAYPDERIV